MFNKLDHYTLKRNPKSWIWGLHTFFLITLVLLAVAFLVGLMFPYKPWPTVRYVDTVCLQVVSIVAVLSMLIAVMYFVRQVRFNARRVHHSLPYKGVLQHFAIFFVFFFMLISLPFSYHLGVYTKFRIAMDEAQFLEDVTVLNTGYIHFYDREFEDNEYIVTSDIHFKEKENDHYVITKEVEQDVAYKTRYTINRPTYYYNEHTGELVIQRNRLVEDYGFSAMDEEHSLWDTLSKEEALAEMEAFAKVAMKYSGQVLDKPFEEVLEEHHKQSMGIFQHDRNWKTQVYGSDHRFDMLVDNERLEEVTYLYKMVDKRNNAFGFLSWNALQAIAMGAAFFAFLLIVLTSVSLPQFGWSMLIVALTWVVYPIATMLVGQWIPGHRYDDWAGLIVMVLLLLLYILLYRSNRMGLRLSRGMIIAIHLLVPAVVFGLFGIFDGIHSCHNLVSYDSELCKNYEYFNDKEYYRVAYWTTMTAIVLSIGWMNRLYKRWFVHPSDGMD